MNENVRITPQSHSHSPRGPRAATKVQTKQEVEDNAPSARPAPKRKKNIMLKIAIIIVTQSKCQRQKSKIEKRTNL